MSSTSHARTPLSGGRLPAGGAGHWLCLNAAEGLLQFCIARREAAGPEDFTLLCAQAWHAPSQGAELLAPALADALVRLGLVPGDIGRIACVRGPGSFTGLRLTLATAAGLARAVGAEQAGIDYLPLLAHSARRRMGNPPNRNEEPAQEGLNAREGQRERPVWILTHARKNLVHVQGFSLPVSRRIHDPGLFFAQTPLTDILVRPPHEAALLIRARWEEGRDGPGRPILLGSGLSRNRTAVAAAFALNAGKAEEPATDKDARLPLLLSPDFDHPLPESLLESAAHAAGFSGDIEPLYARPADAEENLESIALSLGLDPDTARAKLAVIRRPSN